MTFSDLILTFNRHPDLGNRSEQITKYPHVAGARERRTERETEHVSPRSRHLHVTSQGRAYRFVRTRPRGYNGPQRSGRPCTVRI